MLGRRESARGALNPENVYEEGRREFGLLIRNEILSRVRL